MKAGIGYRTTSQRDSRASGRSSVREIVTWSVALVALTVPMPARAADAGTASTAIALQTRVVHGETNSDGTERFLLPLQPEAAAIVQALGQRAHYVAKDGSTIPASVNVEYGKTPADSNVAVTPLRALAPDTWYWLVVATDARLTILDPDVPGGAQWSTHFFTGSAPHVIRIEVPGKGKAPDPVSLTFSEAVDLTTIDGTKAVQADGKNVGRCVLRGTQCWAGSTPWPSNTADLRVDLAALPGILTIRVAGSTQGSGRTVGEGRAFTQEKDPNGDGIAVQLPTNTLTPVSSGGSSFWAEIVPPPP